MRVLVTGSHGYIGSVLFSVVAAAGHDVVGLDTSYYRDCDFGAFPADWPLIDRDLRDVGPDELAGFDAILHYGALSNDPVGDLDPGLTEAINHEATMALARAARQAGARKFIFASSCSMYGASETGEALDESAPLRPLTPYAESKVRSEEGLSALVDDDFAAVSMRNATVYGVSPRLRLDIVLNNLAASAHTTGRIRLLSDGTAWRPLIHVRDLAKTALAILEAPDELVRGESINVGSDEQNYLIRDLAAILSDVSGCEVEIAEGSTADLRSYRVSFSKLRRLFPELTFDWDAVRGARELLECYARTGLTTADFEGDRYVRLRRLRHLLDQGKIDADLRWVSIVRSLA